MSGGERAYGTVSREVPSQAGMPQQRKKTGMMPMAAQVYRYQTHLHGVEHVILRVVDELDGAVRPTTHVLDD